jgi:Glycosyltransferase family 10 (fucosyltransferase) C-term
MIPIQWGDPRVKDYFNPESFICAHDFPSLEDLAEYVLHVDDTPELYARYIRATPFHQNRPNPAYDLNHLVEFFRRIFSSRTRPNAQRRWFFPLTKWRLAKRNKLPGQ